MTTRAARPFEVRQATRKDAETIAKMFQESWPIAWETAEKVRMQFDILDLAQGQVLVAAIGDKVVGHCEFIPSMEPPPYGNYGCVEVLEVHRGYRRMGIGTALVEQAMDICRKAGLERFETVPEDERSEALYAKVGMRTIERFLSLSLALREVPPVNGVVVKDELGTKERPWETMHHAIGHMFCASYPWSSAFHRKVAGSEGYEKVFAQHIARGEAEGVVFFDRAHLHIFVKPQETEEAVKAFFQYGAFQVLKQKRASIYVNVPFALADTVRAVPGVFQSEGHFLYRMSTDL